MLAAEPTEKANPNRKEVRHMLKQIKQRALVIGLAAAPALVVIVEVAGYRVP
jgi:hypothetical protein